jgi:hypothetical protein
MSLLLRSSVSTLETGIFDNGFTSAAKNTTPRIGNFWLWSYDFSDLLRGDIILIPAIEGSVGYFGLGIGTYCCGAK